jgi:5-hydroxyisourate hydrolase-like protein (transthyretin family)
MKKILLLFVLTTILSCDIQYDAEKRLVFQTVVLDSNGAPLPNSHVEITTQSDWASDLISKGKTDSEGRITLIFPSPESDVNINLKFYNDDASYMEKEVLDINKSDFENYKFIYPNAYLLKGDEVAPLNITYNQVSPNTVIKEVTIEGIYHLQYEIYNYDEEYYYNQPYEFLVKNNQAFQLKYTVLNMMTNAETNYSIPLQIGNDAINYTINY